MSPNLAGNASEKFGACLCPAMFFPVAEGSGLGSARPPWPSGRVGMDLWMLSVQLSVPIQLTFPWGGFGQSWWELGFFFFFLL